MIIRVAFALLFSLIAGLAAAGDTNLAGLKISDAWARASIGPGLVGVAYFTLHNEGAAPAELLAVTTPAASEAKLHSTEMEDGVMKMRALKDLTVAPGETLQLAPGGSHVMLTGLAKPLEEGSSFPLTLDFGEAGTVELWVEVLSVASDGPAPE
jgi:copper(I)-binding protein